MSHQTRLGLLLAATLSLAPLAGCLFFDATQVGPQSTGRGPIVHAFDYSPKSAVGLNDAITFTLVATDPGGQVLQYTWTSTRGTLSANTGSTVSWKPAKADGSFDPGLATVTVVISNGVTTSTASVNIQIAADGHASVEQTVLPTPAPDATAVTPAASPSAAPQAPASPAPAGPGKTLFADGFEFELANWQNAYSHQSWQIRRSGAQEGGIALVFGNAEQKIAARAGGEFGFATKNPISLAGTSHPKVSFQLKNGNLPSGVITYTVSLGSAKASFTPVPGETGWVPKEIDLSKAIGESGPLSLSVKLDNTTSIDFDGPMLDNVRVFDAP